MKAFIVAVLVVLLEQHIHSTDAVRCSTNPCNLVPGTFDEANGYRCVDIPPNYNDVVCMCPNNVASVLNAPCRTSVTTNQGFCNRTCVNGGVCNIVNGQQVCWCTLGFSGSNCELQGIATRCSAGVCQAGTCVEQVIGSSCFAYCHCNPGWTGTTCNQCYFTCTEVGVFPDTAFCAVGRYFYCPAINAVPVSAMCPQGQRFNSATKQCDASATC